MAKISVPKAETPPTTLDRVMSSMLVGIFVLTVLAMILYMVGTALGFLTGAMAQGVFDVMLVGLPICMILLITLVVRTAIRRRKENQGA